MVICSVWGFLIGGVAVVAAFFLVLFLIGFSRSIKDPDVKDAVALGMSIHNYKKYKKVWQAMKEDETAGKALAAEDREEWEKFKQFQAGKEKTA